MAIRGFLVGLGSSLSPLLFLLLLAPAALAGAEPTPAASATATTTTAPSAAAPPASRELVLDRQRRILRLIENGQELRRFPVAVGMEGWETPVGSFRVIQKTTNPIWEHPENGKRTPAGGMNPLGSRWIGFHRDCSGRKGWDGERMLDVKGCVVAGFHGTPYRWTVGHALSHGCVRLYDEDVQALFDLVAVGTPVTVLP
ncbi:MAG: L,D-transpeptidase [Synechococcaceae cyanobacterium]|nr:L,D-transpeptidase [Synechococcaceae cyanobacterium]